MKNKAAVILCSFFVAVMFFSIVLLFVQINFAEKVNFQPGKYYAIKNYENPFDGKVIIKVLDRKGDWIQYSFLYQLHEKWILGDVHSDRVAINDEIFEEVSEQWVTEYISRKEAGGEAYGNQR